MVGQWFKGLIQLAQLTPNLHCIHIKKIVIEVGDWVIFFVYDDVTSEAGIRGQRPEDGT